MAKVSTRIFHFQIYYIPLEISTPPKSSKILVVCVRLCTCPGILSEFVGCEYVLFTVFFLFRTRKCIDTPWFYGDRQSNDEQKPWPWYFLAPIQLISGWRFGPPFIGSFTACSLVSLHRHNYIIINVVVYYNITSASLMSVFSSLSAFFAPYSIL